MELSRPSELNWSQLEDSPRSQYKESSINTSSPLTVFSAEASRPVSLALSSFFNSPSFDAETSPELREQPLVGSSKTASTPPHPDSLNRPHEESLPKRTIVLLTPTYDESQYDFDLHMLESELDSSDSRSSSDVSSGRSSASSSEELSLEKREQAQIARVMAMVEQACLGTFNADTGLIEPK